ncbi:MAG: ABC transporter substrate-binding protein [Candidatus Tectomicrobia bacterium]|uniref:ABC transporter substrate-binding protein n=1 Tax=Tectimicrobiota bacterium TaxID=2528274 RepID=A0A932GMT3_UNCTE|nr:ABC transporter substrate-binding protein [Candidatus Tectomicrobia bacterium]
MRRANGYLMVFLFLLSFALVMPVQGQAQLETKKLIVALSAPTPTFFPLVLARDKGFYRAEGLEVATDIVQSGVQVQALIAGKVFAAVPRIEPMLQGVKAKIILVVGYKPSFDLMSQPELKSFADLKGKVVAVSGRGSTTDAVTREILEANGLNYEKDVVLLVAGNMSTMYAALAAKRVAGALLAMPFNFMAMDQGFHKLAFAGDFARAIQGGLMIMDGSLRSESDMVLKVTRGTLKGMLAYRRGGEETLQLLSRFIKTEDLELLKRIYEYHVQTITEDGTISERLMDDLIQQAESGAKGQTAVGRADIFDFSPARKALQTLQVSGWRP